VQGFDYIASPFAYIFFTKPDLNFSDENLASDTSLLNFSKNEYGLDIMKSLTCSPFYGMNDVGSGFIKVLTNTAENFDNSDVSFRTDTYVETFKGYKLQLPIDDVDSITAGTFSISYTEVSGIPITLLHKLWLDYMRGLRLGTIQPTENYRANKVIDFMCSVFYFELAEDGRHIEYYSKYTGVFPTSIPYSSFSWNVGENKTKKLSIQYAYNFKEDLNPEILEDFNQLTSGSRRDSPYSLEYNWVSGVGIDVNKAILYFG